MEREGKRVYVERTMYLKGMKHIKARKDLLCDKRNVNFEIKKIHILINHF